MPIRRSVPKPVRLTVARQRSRFLRPARVDPPPTWPTLKQDTSGTVTTSSPLTFATAPTSGNLLVVAVAGDKASGALTLSPGSWTIEQNLQSASVSDYIAWKVSDGSETTITASVAVPGGNASGWAGEIQQTGTGTWTVLGTAGHVTDENATGYTSWDTGTTAAIAADGIGVAVVAKDSFSAGDTGGTWSNGYTARYKSTVTGGQAGLYVGIKAPETSGTAATSTVTGTGTPSSDQMSGAIAVFARSAPTLIPGNLLTLNQQDIETDSSGWTGINATIGRTSSNPHTGSWALTTTSQAAGDTEAVAASRFGVTPGHGCTLTGWCRPSADRNALVYIAWYAGGVWQSVTGGTSTAVTAGTYTQVTLTDAVAPTGVDEALANLRVVSVGAGEVHQWDTVSALDTGASGGTLAIAGVAASASSATAAVTLTMAFAGAAASTSSATGALTRVTPIAGTAASTTSAAGAVGIFTPIAGVAASTSSATGALAIFTPIAGAAVSTTSATGALTRVTPIAGSAATTTSATGDVTITSGPVTYAITGTAATTTSATGAAGIFTPIAGTAASVTTASGALTRVTPIAGVAATTTSATADLTRVTPIAGVAASATSATGALSIVVVAAIAGVAATTTSATANVTVQQLLNGTAATITGATGAVTLRMVFAGTATSTTAATGAVTQTAAIAGTAASTTSGTATLTMRLAFAGVAASTTSATGAVGIRFTIAAAATTTTTATGAVGIFKALAAAAATLTAAVGDLSLIAAPLVTVRPFTGTTARPGSGTTGRPYTGVTVRP